MKVHTTFYTSNEQLLTQLQTTKGQKTYDIIVPDGDHVRIEKGDGGLGLLAPLDHSKIPNLKYLGPQWRKLSYDPGNKYSVPEGRRRHGLHLPDGPGQGDPATPGRTSSPSCRTRRGFTSTSSRALRRSSASRSTRSAIR